MKVAMLTYSTRARGGVAHALKLSEHLHGLGVEVSLHTLSRDDGDGFSEFYRDTIIPFAVYGFRWVDDVVLRLENMIQAYVDGLPTDADIYHAQDCVGGTALYRLKQNGVLSAPIFRTVHHIDDFAEPRLFEFEKRAVSLAEHRFVVSEYWRVALQRDYGLESTVAHNGVDIGDFSSLPERRDNAPTILFVGGLEPRKGLELLILAMSRVRVVHPRARLQVVAKAGFRGVDHVQWFEHLADRAGVRDRVEFSESVNQDELLGLYSSADIVALPSRNEGWGLSLMEAMACGRPVVATKVGGIPELVRDGVDGVLVEPEDVLGLGEAISTLLDDSELRRRMGSSGRARAGAFSWDRTARLTLQEYKRSLTRNQQTGP